MRLPIELCLFAVLVATIPAAIQCQQSPVQKGSMQVGGTAAVTHERDIESDNSYTVLELLPRVGYFVTRGLAVSGNVTVQKFWAKHGGSFAWGFGPGVTYYFATRAHRLYPFVSARTLFIRSRSHSDAQTLTSPVTITIPADSSKSTSNAWLASGGVLYMLGKHVGVTGELFYQRNTESSRYSNDETYRNSVEVYGAQWGIAAFIF